MNESLKTTTTTKHLIRLVVTRGSGNRKLRMNENQQDLERDLMRQQGQNQRGVHAT